MQQKIISTRDLAFQLYELHEVEKVLRFERYQDHSRETLQAALDEEEPAFENGRVHMRPEVRKALDILKGTGLMAASQDYERGGMQLPSAVAQMCVGMLKAVDSAALEMFDEAF